MGRMTTPVPASFGNLVVLKKGTVLYTPSKGAKLIVVHAVGAGGSGGGGVTGAAGNTSAGSGGGSGSYAKKVISALKASYAIVVGAGGAAPAAGNNNGNVGADTTFDVAVVVSQLRPRCSLLALLVDLPRPVLVTSSPMERADSRPTVSLARSPIPARAHRASALTVDRAVRMSQLRALAWLPGLTAVAGPVATA
jgi:hypothetical protein